MTAGTEKTPDRRVASAALDAGRICCTRQGCVRQALTIARPPRTVLAQLRRQILHPIGDIVGNPILAHKAVQEGHVAAEAASGKKSFFRRTRDSGGGLYRSGSGLGRADGRRSEEARRENREGRLPWPASERAIANGRDEGFPKLIFDGGAHRILGGGIVGAHAGDLINELASAVEMGAEKSSTLLETRLTMGLQSLNEQKNYPATIFRCTLFSLARVRRGLYQLQYYSRGISLLRHDELH
jgi:hypothetical protein